MHKTYYRTHIWDKRHGKPLVNGFPPRSFEVPREEWEEAFRAFLKSCGFDECYGTFISSQHKGDVRYKENAVSRQSWYEDDVFVLRPYYWGNDDRAAHLPNFKVKPTGYELRWYKYPLRGAHANMEMPLSEFKIMLNMCARSWRNGNLDVE